MISSYNEWDSLKSVVVGSAKYANWPTDDPVFAQESEKTLWKETPVPSGPVPDWIVDEANEDLNELARTLHNLGIQVIRPAPRNYPVTGGMYNYCPRDRLLIYGNTIVDPAMMYPCRDQEIIVLDEVVHKSHDVRVMPRDQGMVLDAANICRLNDTWLFLESASGNHLAYKWLQEQFPDVTIELCNFYAGVHIDSTIVPLREGLVLLNGSRVTSSVCPKVFNNWHKIYVHDVVAQDFYQYPYASKWIAMNMLVIDPNTVIVDRHQTDLIKTLEDWNFTVIPLELRHSRTLGGGFHCVTLDLIRESNK
ncbi:COG1834 N-Dimethylarginine dimethylaminohydrolase [uncultured Caudovirales phage]|uniref:COG1834 N-Dimethylarginine dimethylaminohydrolase n=1 Tax=uncultured Caudovirales phage TaxID=2100421 RepID=A0A6J7WMB2_9CAUD|nr:COG1834 N-Dimethylarginine dimethylaminohydrolase [uncultured Caudovirales phage]